MTKKRKLLVTSALPYANGPLHLGHMVEHIQTDIWVRFQRHIGNTCHYMCADDAHGTPIMLSAKRQGITPKQLIDRMKLEHQSDLADFMIDHDEYYTTDSEENRQLSEYIYGKAKEAGAIAEKNVNQHYCESCRMFLPDRYIKGGCPTCHEPDQYGDACEKCSSTYDATDLEDPACAECGAAPVLKDSLHYFFKLSDFTDRLKEWVGGDHVRKEVQNKLQEWFEQGLKDWDISRDAPYFGFQIPGSDNKFFYVWLDAPVGYIATTQHWCEKSGVDFDAIWKRGEYEIHHFIGKDILYFHALFWPAMLMVSELSLPTRVHIHGFLTINGQKMSKSKGTFIMAREYLEHFSPEYLRYYYAAKLSQRIEDIDLSLEDFVLKVNADVVNKYINVASRLGKILNKKLGGKLTSLDSDGEALLATVRASAASIKSDYESLDYHKAQREIMRLADVVNKYIDDKEPWQVVKEDASAAATICTAGLNAFHLLTIYLKPVIPKISEGVETFLNIGETSWLSLSETLLDHQINPYQHLAQRLKQEEVESLISVHQST
ncbi:MAG: methionyl-tRNA synthetase [Candidatus Marinamargulisbacteria bacterium]|jgi:methionyl-tRNA synthetase